jgi:hypothetical protein
MGVIILKPPVKNASFSHSLHRSHHSHKSTSSSTEPNELLIGTKRDRISRALMQFDLSILPSLLTIMNGTLSIYLEENCFRTVSKTLEVFQVLSRWHADSVDWREQPLIAALPAAQTTVINQQNVFLSFNITPLLTNWYTHRAANFGVLFKMASEPKDNQVAIADRRVKNSELWPFIEVNFVDSGPDGGCCRTLDMTLKVPVSNILACTDPLNTLMFNYSYIPVNTGAQTAECYLQTSSDGVHWQTESEVKSVQPNQSLAFVPDTIGKYSRLCCYTLITGATTTLTIHIQGRS